MTDRTAEDAIERGRAALAAVPGPSADPLFPIALLRGTRLAGPPADPRHRLGRLIAERQRRHPDVPAAGIQVDLATA